MKIAFIWYFDKAPLVYSKWRDGLRTAMEIISCKHEVDWFIGKQIPEKHYDFLLFWDDSNSEMFNHLDIADRRGICLTTDPNNIDNLKKLDVVYCESDPILEAVRRNGIRAIKAFGTDTMFFHPNPVIVKDIEYFYPATFSPWKRQSEIAYLGEKLLCVGTVQPDGVNELKACEDNNVKIETGYFHVKKIRRLYWRTKNMIIPAVHGSERTVLEAMACGIVPEVTHKENIRTSSYVEEYKQSGLTPREFVIQNYSHFKYATQLLRGIEWT
jgi:glycosyltransferase involved in cell wall biosynthesis